jgi:hypothetical protein
MSNFLSYEETFAEKFWGKKLGLRLKMIKFYFDSLFLKITI